MPEDSDEDPSGTASMLLASCASSSPSSRPLSCVGGLASQLLSTAGEIQERCPNLTNLHIPMCQICSKLRIGGICLTI